MSNRHQPRPHAGFTLVELLIVVIILAILAAIVIPQFGSATRDTQESALDSNLAGMRNAIELYKAQHLTYPGAVATSAGPACAGTIGAATAGTEPAFVESMTRYSDKAGNTCTVTDPVNYKYGPYIRKALPIDPIKEISTVVVTATGAPITAGATGGWAYDAVSGQIIVNNSANDSKGFAYSLR